MRSSLDLTSISVDSAGNINLSAIPEYAVALEIDFKIKFDDAETYTEPDQIVSTARFNIGNIEWDDTQSNYQDMVLYAYGDKELVINLPQLVGHEHY